MPAERGVRQSTRKRSGGSPITDTEWPPRFHCHVPGVFKSLAAEGYGLLLAPLAGDLNAIARRAVEINDPVLLRLLTRMGLGGEIEEHGDA